MRIQMLNIQMRIQMLNIQMRIQMHLHLLTSLIDMLLYVGQVRLNDQHTCQPVMIKISEIISQSTHTTVVDGSIRLRNYIHQDLNTLTACSWCLDDCVI